MRGFCTGKYFKHPAGLGSFFYRTSNGAEIDLLLIKGKRRIAVEFKSNTAPKVSKGFFNSVHDLDIKERFIVAPIERQYPIKNGIVVSEIGEFLRLILRQHDIEN